VSCKDCEQRKRFDESFDEGIPYDETHLAGNVYIRRFSQDANPDWLKWHWDEQKRVVRVIKDSDWMFQYDNELPIKLTKGTTVTIPEGKYHRVIKGSTSLELEIFKF